MAYILTACRHAGTAGTQCSGAIPQSTLCYGRRKNVPEYVTDMGDKEITLATTFLHLSVMWSIYRLGPQLG